MRTFLENIVLEFSVLYFPKFDEMNISPEFFNLIIASIFFKKIMFLFSKSISPLWAFRVYTFPWLSSVEKFNSLNKFELSIFSTSGVTVSGRVFFFIKICKIN